MTSEEYFKKHRLQKIYYFKKNDGTAKVIGNFCLFPQKEITYYDIDAEHSILCDFIFHWEETFNRCESTFHEYIDIALSEDYAKTDISYDMLCTLIKRIHPFFHNYDNIKIYIQEKILWYFYKSFEYFVTTLYKNTPVEEIEPALRRKFSLAIAPTVINERLSRDTVLTSNSDGKYPSDALWSKLCILITGATDKKISAIIKGTISWAKSYNESYSPYKYVFDSLFHLKNILTYYICVFSEFIFPQKSTSNSQMLFFFLSRRECTYLLKILNDQKIISTPQELFGAMMCQIKAYYRDGNTIELDGDYLLVEDYTNSIYEHTLDSFQSIPLQSLSQILPPELENLLDYEIHELYYFEQLIYMELYQILTENMLGRKCNRPGCTHCFFSSDRKRVYCRECSAKPNSADQAYRQSLPPISKFKKRFYDKISYQIRKREKSNHYTDSENRAKLTDWQKKATKLEKEFISDNRQDDISSFESELKQLAAELGLKFIL